MQRKEHITRLLHELGFELVGFARPEPPPHLDAYRAWVAEGLHAGMGYLATERAVSHRSDPRLILPEVKTILVVGLRYENPLNDQPTSTENLTGRVASYAWGDDYHQVIVPRLKQAAGQIEQWLGSQVRFRPYSDTGPILERDFAMQAGLGWIGKNTCLISPRHGSYFLLGELFLDVEIEPDEPMITDHCGSCRRCIDACPTDCIRPDRTLDAGRCISYLTIEHKGAVPRELRGLLGDWIFGCDICQQVCPWNIRFATLHGDPGLSPHSSSRRPELLSEIQLTPAEFNRKFKHSPIQRARRRGYLRNVAIALGNSRHPEAVKPLAECLDNEPEPLIRAHAAWALGNIGTAKAISALEKAARIEQDEMVLDEIAAAIP